MTHPAPRHILLAESNSALSIRILSDRVTVDAVTLSVDAEKKSSVVTITRTGKFFDPRYGEFSITREKLLSMVKNFEANVYGQDIAIDVAHAPEKGAAGYVKRLFVENGKLRALVEWTSYGVDSIKHRGYQYLSAEYHENFEDNESRKSHGPTLLGAGLVVRPCIKHLDRVELAEASLFDCPTVITEQLHTSLASEIKMNWELLLKKLREYCATLKLSDAVVAQLIALATGQLKLLTEQVAADALITQLMDTAKTLAESNATSANITLAGLSREDVLKLLDEQRAQDARERAEKHTQRAKVLSACHAVISARAGLTDLVKAELIELSGKLLSESATEDEAKLLGEHLASQGEQAEALKKLAGMGMNVPAGVVHVYENAQTNAVKLQEVVHEKLRRSTQHATGALRLTKQVSPFVEKVLAEFDRLHAPTIAQEVKMLAGETTISDSSLPVGFQREVIREALSDLNVLQLVQTLSDPTATATTQIPYEERDTSAVIGDGIVFERQAIPKVKARQRMELAYINAMKIAFEVSNEAMHFTRASAINWDAWAANIATASRTMKELLHRRIANTIQRVSDGYLAATITNENIKPQLAGALSQIKTAQFPIVQPHQIYDLQGNAVGSTSNPITITFDAAQILPYDGTGTQAAGTYYVIVNHNLGYIRFVNQLGVAVTPNPTAATITYRYATNLLKVDADVPGTTTLEKHLNGLLRAVGSQKAVMKDDRYVTPDFLLMSNTLNNTASNAEEFVATLRRNGTDTGAVGDLETIKGIPSWETNAPGVHLGDNRIQLGVKGACSYTIAKPFTLSEIQEARNSSGQLIGAKEIYGEEYGSIHVPGPIANRFTSVLFYSYSNR